MHIQQFRFKKWLLNSENGNAKKTIFKIFLLVFIPIAIIFSLLYYFILNVHYNSDLLTLREHEVAAYPLISSKPDLSSAKGSEYESVHGIKKQEYYWKVAAFSPTAQLPNQTVFNKFSYLAIYILGLMIDAILAALAALIIYKRKQADVALQNSMREITDLYDNAPLGYHSIDDKGIYVRINSTELKWLGYTREEIIGKKKAADFLTPTSLLIFNEIFPKFKKRGYINDIEYEMVRKDGSCFTVLLTATAIYDKDGKYLMSRSNLTDITTRKQIESALRESEEKFRSAMDTAPIGMAIVSLEGRFLSVNQTLCDVVGYSKHELEQLTFQEITHEEDFYQDYEYINNLKEGKIAHYKIEKRYIRKDNSLVWVQLTVSILRNTTTQKPLYYIAQVEDISARKHHQEKIQQLAYLDTLTNLPNRRLLLDRIDQAIIVANQNKHHLAIMFVDIDRFKTINDTLGHEIGDDLLNLAATRLTNCVSMHDTVSRTGGDEFVILLTNLHNQNLPRSVSEKILEAMRAPFYIRKQELKITVSIGISLFPLNGNNTKSLLRVADSAMYNAKKAGKNQAFFCISENSEAPQGSQ